MICIAHVCNNSAIYVSAVSRDAVVEVPAGRSWTLLECSPAESRAPPVHTHTHTHKREFIV